jgi:hypothetical protein|tara:strand:+ start:60 stop:254 length:195 start_codon:yes stop_codon:yes gene_type:complete
MKAIVTVAIGMLIVASGCSSTVTLGPKANDTEVLGATAGTGGVSLTLPLIRGEVTPTTPTETKK